MSPFTGGPAKGEPAIDPATSRDVRTILRLIEEAGWAYTRSEVERLIAVQPRGMLLMRSPGIRHEVVGCVYASAWGHLGFVGLMLVRRSHRGRGLGRELMLAAIKHLRREGTTAVGLDAVGVAIGFYTKLGFSSLWESLRFGIDTGKVKLPAPSMDVRRADDVDLHRVIELDRARAGVDRASVLRRVHADPDCTVLVVPGMKEVLAYGVLRRSKGCIRLGPLVVQPGNEGPMAAKAVLAAAVVDTYPRTLTVNVPAYNREATETLVAIGAVTYLPFLRMCLGDMGPAEAPAGVWAMGAAEKG